MLGICKVIRRLPGALLKYIVSWRRKGERPNTQTKNKNRIISCIDALKDINRLLELRISGPGEGIGLFSMPLFSDRDKTSLTR